MKKIFKLALVAFAAAAVAVACQKPAQDQKQDEQKQQEEETPAAATTADLYVVNTPGWEAPVLWAWGGAIAMPGEWPNGIEPEAATVTVNEKVYVHFVLGEAFITEGVGFLVVDKTTSVQTVDAAGLSIKAGDKLYYEIGAEAGGDGKFSLTPIQ